ncbi:AfsR/SARP family transcriptional regulator [Actinospica robiniae]|uniref:AfsR/SARP family transcriptional regulator n=1 Tax=Actinospica robiniae TaxID=304901 RepID=UPI0004089B3B|nr:AfsR/SARP family transcriptional regulator [Actinospica robiniae]
MMSVVFGLLGPVRAAVDGRDIVISALRQREVFAALLLHPNRSLRPAELAALVWSDRPPAAWRGTLQSHVMRLRRTLGPEAGARIRTTPTGYAVRVAEDELDTLALAAHHAVGIQALGRHDWETAAGRFAAALSLFRGDPLADVEGLAARSGHLARFDELRVRAAEGRIDADLALGRQAEVIGELRALVHRHPLRERPHAQLIDALAGVGRRAEALEVYRSLRARMIEELGIEPGEAARQAHLRALTHAPVRVVETDPGRYAPDLLPPLSAHWVGREAELAAVCAALGHAAHAGGTPLMVITGSGGIGKTALAVSAARQCATLFPHGRLFLRLGAASAEPVPAAEVPRLLLGQLGFADYEMPRDTAHRQRLVADVLAHRRVLVVLDEVDDGAALVPLIPRSGASALIVTGRAAPLAYLPGRVLGLTGLDDAASLALLRMAVGAARVDREPCAAEAIVEACGGLPLALRIATARLASRPAWALSKFAERLADPENRLRELRLGEVSVRAVLDAGLRAAERTALPGAAAPARILRLLGSMPAQDLGLDAVCALADAPPQQVEDSLEALVDHYLAESPEIGVYRLRALQHAYAAQLSDVLHPARL